MSNLITYGYGLNQNIATFGFGETGINSLKSLLRNQWNINNTDSIRPTIVNGFEHPKSYQIKANEDVIYINFLQAGITSSGVVSSVYGNMFETYSLDIRTRGVNGDAHARKVIYEVQRILKQNIVREGTVWSCIDLDISYEDRSEEHFGIFRYVVDLTLQTYRKDFS